jgi:hypothetical protein
MTTWLFDGLGGGFIIIFVDKKEIIDTTPPNPQPTVPWKWR